MNNSEKSEIHYEEDLSINVVKINLSTTNNFVQITAPRTYNLSCQFYDEKGDRTWKMDGCETTPISDDVVECSCDHMTPFAVLLIDLSDSTTSEEQWEILSYISYVGCSLSVLFSACTVLMFIFNSNARAEVSSSIHVSLSGALFLLNMSFMLNEWAATLTVKDVCVFMAVTIHYSLLCSFTWMAIEALHLYLLLIRVFNIYIRHYMVKLSLIGWGILITVSRQIFKLRHMGNRHDKMPVWKDAGTVMGLMCLLGTTWGLAFFSSGYTNYPILYLFCILNTMQGERCYEVPKNCQTHDNVPSLVCCQETVNTERGYVIHISDEALQRSSNGQGKAGLIVSLLNDTFFSVSSSLDSKKGNDPNRTGPILHGQNVLGVWLGEKEVHNLSQPVQLTFLNNINQSENGICVYWHLDKNGKGNWRTDGCTTSIVNDSFVCSCQKDIDLVCQGLGLLLHWCLLATFTWTAIEGFHLYLLLVRVFNIYIKRYLLKLSLVGWGVPAITVIICGVTKVYGKYTFYKDKEKSTSTPLCWITTQTVSYITVNGYLGLVMLFNMVMLVVLLIKMRRLRSQSLQFKDHRRRAWREWVSVLGLCCVLGVPWVLAFSTHGPLSLSSLYVFTILNSFQGVYIFLWFLTLTCKAQKDEYISSKGTIQVSFNSNDEIVTTR
ncbi:adhesion G -coupled receptor G3-like protein [Labeo rohita]|uniref:Adhesion G-coupled receptor G3-like protein n=1 Tax=Labeo rohita TaxID=84645 RepID=A0A498MA24_LABRO|nr:adhesion G -coupled receptor G3-like protein [Labeo rohita]